MPGKVYLSGPIAGLSYDGATSWRATVAAYLESYGITALDPMRGKEYLRGQKVLHAQPYDDELMSTAKAITTRDRFDCMRADLCLVNLLQAGDLPRLSLGTIMEVGWADAARIPIICARKPGTYDHPMFNEAIGFEVDNIYDAQALIVDMLR